MQVNIAQLLKSSIGAERVYKVDEDIEIDGKDVRVAGDVKLIRTNRGILAKGNLTTGLEIECSRCLERFIYTIKMKFEEEYFPTIDVLSGLPVAIPEEQPVYFTIDENHVIDLDEAIRQYALLAIPMKPLCKAECAGICPYCGENLNLETCKCPPEVVASRLTSLNKLMESDK